VFYDTNVGIVVIKKDLHANIIITNVISIVVLNTGNILHTTICNMPV
jgi:hypothetical protein